MVSNYIKRTGMACDPLCKDEKFLDKVEARFAEMRNQWTVVLSVARAQFFYCILMRLIRRAFREYMCRNTFL